MKVFSFLASVIEKTILGAFSSVVLYHRHRQLIFMPVQDVQTGMEGIAKTVIVGDTISNFNVKVLGVMKDKGPSGHFNSCKVFWPCYGTDRWHCAWYEW